MALWVIIGALAAFGLLCALWVLLGWLLSGGVGGSMVCVIKPGGAELPFLRRCLWLHGLGLLRGPILLIDGGLSAWERKALCQLGSEIEFCSPGTLVSRLELERERLGGTGT